MLINRRPRPFVTNCARERSLRGIRQTGTRGRQRRRPGHYAMIVRCVCAQPARRARRCPGNRPRLGARAGEVIEAFGDCGCCGDDSELSGFCWLRKVQLK